MHFNYLHYQTSFYIWIWVVGKFKSIISCNITCQADFNEWHERVCCELNGVYKQGNYKKFNVGQAQKWINMTFKYIYTHG